MADQFIFTITTGRSGTVFLTELCKANIDDALIFHERAGWDSFGVNTPDASDFMQFNSRGNTKKIQAFWQQKWQRDSQTPQKIHIEISHWLAKAGLIENSHLLTEQGCDVYFIILKRDVFKTAWSFLNRHDFANLGFTWLFALDYRYPKNLIDPKPFLSFSVFGNALWYCYEMRARARYYQLLYQDNPNMHFIECDLEDIVTSDGATDLFNQLNLKPKNQSIVIPSKQNETKHEVYDAKVKDQCLSFYQKIECDYKAIAERFFNSGSRI